MKFLNNIPGKKIGIKKYTMWKAWKENRKAREDKFRLLVIFD